MYSQHIVSSIRFTIISSNVSSVHYVIDVFHSLEKYCLARFLNGFYFCEIRYLNFWFLIFAHLLYYIIYLFIILFLLYYYIIYY